MEIDCGGQSIPIISDRPVLAPMTDEPLIVQSTEYGPDGAVFYAGSTGDLGLLPYATVVIRKKDENQFGVCHLFPRIGILVFEPIDID